jgi:hypothetical protein
MLVEAGREAWWLEGKGRAPTAAGEGALAPMGVAGRAAKAAGVGAEKTRPPAAASALTESSLLLLDLRDRAESTVGGAGRGSEPTAAGASVGDLGAPRQGGSSAGAAQQGAPSQGGCGRLRRPTVERERRRSAGRRGRPASEERRVPATESSSREAAKRSRSATEGRPPMEDLTAPSRVRVLGAEVDLVAAEMARSHAVSSSPAAQGRWWQGEEGGGGCGGWEKRLGPARVEEWPAAVGRRLGCGRPREEG